VWLFWVIVSDFWVGGLFVALLILAFSSLWGDKGFVPWFGSDPGF
jgi:hypothetical protein